MGLLHINLNVQVDTFIPDLSKVVHEERLNSLVWLQVRIYLRGLRVRVRQSVRLRYASSDQSQLQLHLK